MEASTREKKQQAKVAKTKSINNVPNNLTWKNHFWILDIDDKPWPVWPWILNNQPMIWPHASVWSKEHFYLLPVRALNAWMVLDAKAHFLASHLNMTHPFLVTLMWLPLELLPCRFLRFLNWHCSYWQLHKHLYLQAWVWITKWKSLSSIMPQKNWKYWWCL